MNPLPNLIRPVRLPERTSPRYPFLLLTGRGSSSQWHTQTRTGKSKPLSQLSPARIYAEINPEDARSLGIRPSDLIRIRSRRGRIRVRAFVTPTVQPGQIFIPMHYPTVNQLTIAAFDPYSRQPAYKASAVAIEPLEHWE